MAQQQTRLNRLRITKEVLPSLNEEAAKKPAKVKPGKAGRRGKPDGGVGDELASSLKLNTELSGWSQV